MNKIQWWIKPMMLGYYIEIWVFLDTDNIIIKLKR